MKHKEIFDIAAGIRLTAIQLEADASYRLELGARILEIAHAVEMDMGIPLEKFTSMDPATELEGPRVELAIQGLMQPFPAVLHTHITPAQPEHLQAAA